MPKFAGPWSSGYVTHNFRDFPMYRNNQNAQLKLALRKGMRRGMSYTGTTSKRGTKSGQGVTEQRDRALIYRRRKAPRRVRTRKKRWTNKIKRTLAKLGGARTLLTNSSHVVTAAGAQQGTIDFVLFGGRVDGLGSSQKRGYDDMNDLRQRDYLIGDATGDAEYRASNGAVRFMVSTAIMDLTIHNATVENPEDNVPLEIDVYEFACGEWPKTLGSNILDAWNTLNVDAYMPGAGGANMSTLQLYDRGCTPFELPNALKGTKTKIFKKTKYFVPVGDTVTYQIRQTKIRQFAGDALYRHDSPVTRYTQGLIIVSKPLAGLGDIPHTYTIGCTRKYKYHVIQNATTRSAYWDPNG